MLDKPGFKRKSLVERWADHLVGAVEGASEGLRRIRSGLSASAASAWSPRTWASASARTVRSTR